MNKFNGENFAETGINYAPNADDGAEEIDKKNEIIFSPEDQEKLDAIEQEALKIDKQIRDFAVEIGIDPETEFTIENDQKLLLLARDLADAIRKEINEYRKVNETDPLIAFVPVQGKIDTIDDFEEIRSWVEQGSKKWKQIAGRPRLYSKKYPHFGADLISQGCHANEYDQLILQSQWNGDVPANADDLTLMTASEEVSLRNAYKFVSTNTRQVNALQYRFIDVLKSYDLFTDIQNYSKHDQFGVLINKENTFPEVCNLEKVSRDMVRTMVQMSVIMSQRIAYLVNQFENGDSRFRFVEIDNLAPTREDNEYFNKYCDRAHKLFNIDPEEVVKTNTTICLVDMSFEFTEADAKAAEEADLPWSKIRAEKAAAQAGNQE